MKDEARVKSREGGNRLINIDVNNQRFGIRKKRRGMKFFK